MKILIFTCLCQCATHCCNVALHPLQMLLVLSAAHNEGKDVFLQLKHGTILHFSLPGRGRKMRAGEAYDTVPYCGIRWDSGQLPDCLTELIR